MRRRQTRTGSSSSRHPHLVQDQPQCADRVVRAGLHGAGRHPEDGRSLGDRPTPVSTPPAPHGGRARGVQVPRRLSRPRRPGRPRHARLGFGWGIGDHLADPGLAASPGVDREMPRSGEQPGRADPRSGSSASGCFHARTASPARDPRRAAGPRHTGEARARERVAVLGAQRADQTFVIGQTGTFVTLAGECGITARSADLVSAPPSVTRPARARSAPRPAAPASPRDGPRRPDQLVADIVGRVEQAVGRHAAGEHEAPLRVAVRADHHRRAGDPTAELVDFDLHAPALAGQQVGLEPGRAG